MAARMSAEKPKNTRRTVARLLHYIGRSGWLLIALLVIMLAVTAADLLGPFFQAKAIDTITLKEGQLAVDLEALTAYLVMMGIIFVCSATLSFFQGTLSARLSQQTVRVMRADLFKKISRLPIGYTDSHRHGDIMSRMTNDVENVSNAISQSITALVSGVITLVGAFSMMLILSPLMTLVAVVTVPLSIFISTKIVKGVGRFPTLHRNYHQSSKGSVPPPSAGAPAPTGAYPCGTTT